MSFKNTHYAHGAYYFLVTAYYRCTNGIKTTTSACKMLSLHEPISMKYIV